MKIILLIVCMGTGCATARLADCPDSFDLAAERAAFEKKVRAVVGDEAADASRTVTLQMSFECYEPARWPYADHITGVGVQPRAARILVRDGVTFRETAATHEWAHYVRREMGEASWREHTGQRYKMFSMVEEMLRFDERQYQFDARPFAIENCGPQK